MDHRMFFFQVSTDPYLLDRRLPIMAPLTQRWLHEKSSPLFCWVLYPLIYPQTPKQTVGLTRNIGSSTYDLLILTSFTGFFFFFFFLPHYIILLLSAGQHARDGHLHTYNRPCYEPYSLQGPRFKVL